MVVYGLTGGIGMGKSTAAGFLAGLGIPVVDTDDLAREAVRPGSEGLREVVARFGSGVLLPGGGVDRKRLGEIVFGDAEKRKELEAILHPLIRRAWQARIADWERAGEERAVVVVPLLFETGAEVLVSKTVCVACREETQAKRLRERGWSELEIAARLRAQWAVAQKMASSDYVVWTEGRTELTKKQLERIVG